MSPWLSGWAIAEIKAPDVLAVLRRAEARGALDTAHRVHQNCGQVFRYAVATGRAERDINSDLRGALLAARHTHFASMTDPAEVASHLRALDAFQGTFVVQCALRFALFPSEVMEHQLAHKVSDSLGTAYNRTKFIDDRIVMMQAWADYLDELKVSNHTPVA